MKYTAYKPGITMPFKKAVLVLGIMAMVPAAWAQENKQLQSEEVIEQQQSRKVEQAVKIPDKPVYQDSVVTPLPVKYNALGAQAATTVVPEPLKAANLTPKEMLDKLYRFYTRLGVGNYTNVLGELYYNMERHATNDFGVHYKHLSSQGGINNKSFSGFSTNELAVYGGKIWDRYKGNAEVLYNRNVVHFYGFDPEIYPTFARSDTKQVYNTLLFKLSGGSHYASDSGKIVHKESVAYRPYFDNYGANEHNVNIDISGGKRVGKEFYGLGLLVDYNQVNDDSCNCLSLFKAPLTYKCIQQQTNLILGFNPTVTTVSGDLKIKLGLMVNGDIYDKGKFYFFPDIEFSYSLFNAILVPYAGVNRSIIRNSLYTLSKQNPFMVTNTDYINANQKLNVYGGIRGAWSANLSFNSKISYSRNENVALFVEDNTYSMQNRFQVIYDDIDILTADAHILFRTSSKWHVLAGGTYYKYSTLNQTYAWNMPQYKIYATLNYNLKDKIIVKYNLELLGNRKAYSMLPVDGITAQPGGMYIVDLKAFVDTDIQLEYRYTPRFSIFANFNNLAGQYTRWLNYPYQGLNMLGGITYMF